MLPPSELAGGTAHLNAFASETTTEMQCKMFCMIISSGSTFPVKIDETKTVDHLKDAIKKKENELRTVDADTLTLYRVEIEINKSRIKKTRID